MAKIEFPAPLKKLLEDSDLLAPLRSLADRVGEILSDNKHPFFPDYTDHGMDHVQRVLESEVSLVDKIIWERCHRSSETKVLIDADAAVIIGATLLHDIAMHLRPAGFISLVSKDSKFKPLPWFKDAHEGHRPDLPWSDLWGEYVQESKRFSDRKLVEIVGENAAKSGWKFTGLPEEIGRWSRNDELIIGEFIRRHHARLAHEIAIYGFPSVPPGEGEGYFPAMGMEKGHPLSRLADLIGLTARSHGMSLRVCKESIESRYPGTPKPMGTAVLYPMALLRVADYLQLDRQRAPAVLLQLRDPQSPISVQEWSKHLAVQSITPATDPQGVMITVSPDLSLELILQLSDLIRGLQQEMDHATAVLDETYGNRADLGLDLLKLRTRRVYSNLDNSSFLDALPFEPRRTGFTADPNLLTLLVAPLYGAYPGVGVRELIQNAVDAVRERIVLEELQVPSQSDLGRTNAESDVSVEFLQQGKEWILRISDNGAGMSAETVENYFLRAGASFRQSANWSKSFHDENGKAKVLRSGRFGVGAFSIFLLGPSFKLWTRHISDSKSGGHYIEARADSRIIPLQRVCKQSAGTIIEVLLSETSVVELGLFNPKNEYQTLRRATDWYTWLEPRVVRKVVTEDSEHFLKQEVQESLEEDPKVNHWFMLCPTGFDNVYWTYNQSARLTCNGIRIARPTHSGYFWNEGGDSFWPETLPFKAPFLAIKDSEGNLPLTTQRYELSQRELPFQDALFHDITLSFIAHSLVFAPANIAEALFSGSKRFPLLFHPIHGLGHSGESGRGIFADSRLRWCVSKDQGVPLDPWLIKALDVDQIILFGALDNRSPSNESYDQSAEAELIRLISSNTRTAFARCDAAMRDSWMSGDETETDVAKWLLQILSSFTSEGVPMVCDEGASCELLLSVSSRLGREMLSSNKASRRFGSDFMDALEDQHQKIGSRSYFRLLRNSDSTTDFLDRMVEVLERSDPHQSQGIFALKVRLDQHPNGPESHIARDWDQALGQTAIPFSKQRRRTITQKLRMGSDISLHLDYWKTLLAQSQPTGSQKGL